MPLRPLFNPFNRVALVGGLLLAALAVYALIAWRQQTAVVTSIKIGVLHSLTGTMAISEKPLVDALQLAIEEANAAGGIKGQQIEAVVVDCRSDAAYCAQQAERLIVRGKGQRPVRLLDLRLPQGGQAGGRKAPAPAVLPRAV